MSHHLARPIVKLIESFESLPGIGPKSAARLTFYLLHVPQVKLEQFAQNLISLKKNTKECSICFNVSESDPCNICGETNRDTSIICVVEQPLDILSLERTGKYNGIYHVLHGSLNPLQNIGPEEIRIDALLRRLKKNNVSEVILATNLNMEGEATAMYIQRQITNAKLQTSNKHAIKVSRLAHGLPMGADLEYADEMTLSQALEGRREY